MEGFSHKTKNAINITHSANKITPQISNKYKTNAFKNNTVGETKRLN